MHRGWLKVGFSCGSAGKESTCSAGNLGLIPGLGRSPRGGNTPVFWPGELHGLMYSPWGHKESDMTVWLSLTLTTLTDIKGEINSSTIIVGDFNTPLTPMDISTKQKISKETQTLNDKMDQLDLIDTYRTFHPKTMNFTFLGHKYSLVNSKKLKPSQASFLITMQ